MTFFSSSFRHILIELDGGTINSLSLDDLEGVGEFLFYSLSQ